MTKNDATFVTMGNLHAPQAILAIIGFFIIASLDFFKIKGAILIGILTITIISMALGYTTFNGLVSAPPSIAPTLLQLDIKAAIEKGIFNVVLVFVLVEIFDATGVLTGLAKRAGLVGGSKDNASINRALFADSASIFGGSLLGTQGC